ncbi:hypothetical protein [Cyanobium sp. Morenito 9A2]|uniref:hypothetical protein n=1 Tax=Cyanobium sp. Morenito 9A2 TaxID=2823718 RepID=UPI0020CF2D51|nr:hypothetical protein [Cyanobium sp. Morenito 9A2]MCP9850008.1 hypothetical protein [Cyanobium sp. Morenito 9A2]
MSLLRPWLPALLAAAALVLPTATGSAQAATPSASAASLLTPALQSLETALNSGAPGALAAVLVPGPGLVPALIEGRRRSFKERFPDARWQVLSGPPLADGRASLTLRITGSRTEGPFKYRLLAEQVLAVSTSGARLSAQEVIQESSILRSGDADLKVSLLIPDAVLTGQRYDVDVVFDEPLNGAVAAGGLSAVTPEQAAAQESPEVRLAALGGGGLFKTVLAPDQPGGQIWAVLLVHPDGIVSASKRVRVVSSAAALKI